MESKKIRIIKHLLRTGAFLQREGSRLLVDLNLNQQQFVVLKEIQDKAPVSQKEICNDLLFEKSNVSKIVKKLIDSKLVKLSPSKTDKRVGLLVTTAKGDKTIEHCMVKLNEWNDEWLKPFSAKEIDKTLEVLGKIANLIKQ